MGPVGDVVVEVETDAGITGVGHGNWATGAIETIVDETLSKLVVGEDPRQRERLWDLMYRATIPFGRKGAAIEAISAVDLALWDVAGYAEVRESTSIPISGGEHEFTRWGHEELLERGAVDVLQPDVHRWGGLTELLKIDSLASTHDVPVIPHSGTNPHLHFIAASANAPMAEYFPIPEWYREQQADRESTYAGAVYADPPNAEGGTLSLPDGVGLSSELNRDALAEFALE